MEIIQGRLHPDRMAQHYFIQYGCLIAHEDFVSEFALKYDRSWMEPFWSRWRELDKFFDEYDRLVIASD